MILSPLDGLDSFIQRDISLKKGLYSFNFTPIHLEHAFSFFEQHSIYHVTEKGLKHASVNELAEWARAESLEVSDFIKENKINGKEILLHANEINTLLNGTIILQKYKKYKRSYGENMLKQRNNNMVDKFVFQLINSPVPLQNPYSPQQIYFDSIRLFFMTNHDIIDPITAFSIGKLKSSHSSCIEKDIIHLLNDIGVVRMNTFIRTLHFIQNITKIPNCFWCDCLDLFQAYMLNLLIPSKSFEEIRFLLDIPFEIPTYECFDSNELYIGEYVLDSFEDVLIPLKMIRVEESVSEITTENWIQGTLFITNYRLYFSTKNTNYLFTDIVYVSHCPIQMIRVAHFYTNKKIYDNHSITKDNKYIWRIATKDFRYITFAFQEPETIKYVKKAFHDAKQTISPISYNDLFGELVDTKHIPVPNNHHISNDIRQVFVSPNGISINGHTLGYVNTSQATVYRIKSTTPLTIESISTLFKSVEEFFYSNDQVKTTPLDDEKHFSSTHFKYYNHGIVLFNFSNEDNKGNTLLPQSEIDTLIRPFCDKIPNKKDIDALQTCLDNLHQLLYKLVTETNNNNIILLATSPNNETDLGILTSILCVAIDPFSRTIEGLLRIIHDEFCLQGVFETAVEKVFWPSYFILFLCLVHSFYVEYPTAFEYTPEALAFLFFHCQSGRFQFFTSQPTCSIKRVLQRFINPKYQMREEVLFKKEVNVYPLCEYFQPMLSLEKYVDNNVKLDCSYCGLKYFPSFKSHIKYLSVATYLDLSFNTIPTLTLFTQSQTLQHLNISNNPFRHIDKSLFTSCPNLTFLDISASHHVEIGKIPELTTLTKLLFLNISNLLLLHQYSDSMSFPISLKTLIAKDSFQELPPSLFTLKLHSLKLSGALHSKHDLFLMTELHTLSLANMHLSTVPSVVSNLVSLTHLDLSNNRLIALPHQLYSLTSLKQLFLKENNIQFISHQLSQLTSLTKLQLPEMCHCPVKHPTLISSPRFNLKQPKTVHILLFNKVAYNEDSCYQTLRSYLTQLKCVHSDFITLKEDHPLIIHRMETNIHINPLDFPQSDIYMSIVDDTEYMHQLKESHSFYLRILPVDQKVVIAVHANTNNTTKIDTSDISNVAHTVFGPRPFNIITLRDPKKTESLLKKHLCVASEPTPLPNENLLLYEVSINSFDPSLTYTTTLLPLLEKCNIPLLNLPQYLIRLHYYGAIFSLDIAHQMLQTNSKRFKENEIEIFDQQPTSMMITSRKLFRTIFGRMRQIKGFGSLSNVLFTPSLIASFTPEAIDLLLQVYTWYNPLYVPTLNWLEQRGLVDSYHSFRTALEASSPWETETSHLRNSKFSQHIGKQHLVDSPTSSSPALLFRNTSCYQDELIETEDESCGCYLHFRPLRYVDRLASDWPQRHERFEVEFGLVIHQEVTILTRMKATLHLALLDFKILKNTQGYTIFEKRFKTEKFYIYTGFNQHLEIRLRFLAKGISTINLANSIFINLLEILKDSNIPIHNENSYALCCHCLQQGIEPGIIPLMDIQKEFGKGFIVLSCGHKVNSIVCLPYYMKQHIESVTLQNTKSFQYEDVKIESEIGVGSAAKVVKCRVDDTTSAMKIYSDSFQDLFHNEHSGEGVMQVFADLMNEVVTEIEIMCTCQSPNIIQLFGVCFEPTALVVEYCENGSLFDFIHSGEWLTWGMRIRFSIGIANAISALHENNYVHRDLKSPNILLKTVNGELVCVLTDFGCSGKEGSNITSIVENPSWLAPEIIRQEGNFTKAADIYSYGIILWELVSREQPYGDVKFFTEIKEKVVNGIRPKKVRIDYKQYGMLLDRCLDEKMEFRPTIKEVLELLHSITIKEEIN